MRRRFYVDRFESQSAALRGDSAEHLGRVLRAEPGQLYELSDGHRVWLAKVERVALSKRGENRIEFALVEPVPVSEPRVQIALLISLVKFDRFEWCLEKATELGAGEIIPLAAARTDRPLISAATKRRDRWRKILVESAQQSRRLAPPNLHQAMTPEEAFSDASAGLRILLSERADAPSLRTVLVESGRIGNASFSSDNEVIRTEGAVDVSASRSSSGWEATAENVPRSAALAIGPEGGWTDAEITAARAASFVEASLGENILRTETAVLASMAIVGFALAG